MGGDWGVFSEVGPLRTVLVHQPGYEHRQTVPWNKDALLFDDVMDVEEARPQHHEFTHLLGDHGAEVLFLGDLLRDVWSDEAGREEMVAEVVGEEAARRIAPGTIDQKHFVLGYPDRYSLAEPALLQPLPNLYFTRDPAFAVPGALVISHPTKVARQRESRLLLAILRRHPRFAGATIFTGILEDADATLEGGDVHVVDESTVMVGIGERTNRRGAELLAEFLFAATPVDRLLLVEIPARREFMHLDTVMTFVDRKRLLTLPYLWDRPELYAAVAERSRRECEQLGYPEKAPDPEVMREPGKLTLLQKDGTRAEFEDVLQGLAELGVIDPKGTIFVAGRLGHFGSPEEHIVEALREQWNDAANVLALKPGQVVAYSRNDRTFRALEEEGIEVLSFRGGELVRGRGGARCMSMPVRREGA